MNIIPKTRLSPDAPAASPVAEPTVPGTASPGSRSRRGRVSQDSDSTSSEAAPVEPLRAEDFGKAPWWSRPSFFWLCLIPAAVALWTLTQTLAQNDFWFWAAAGRVLSETGHIPTTNIFSWGLPADHPYLYQSWIAQWLFFHILRLSGISGIILIRTLCAVAGFSLVTWTAWRRVRRAVPVLPQARAGATVALSGLAALGMTMMNMDMRPQTFAVPLFGVVVWILFEWPVLAAGGLGKRALLGAAAVLGITVLWANLHGSFFLVFVLFTGAGLAELAAHIIRCRGWGSPLSWAGAGALAAIGIGSLLAASINPRGIGLFGYVAKLSSYGASPLIMEWKPPVITDKTGAAFFGSTLILAAVALLAGLRSTGDRSEGVRKYGIWGLRAGELALIVLFFVMGSRNLRSVLWFALLFVPVASTCAAFYLARAGGLTAPSGAGGGEQGLPPAQSERAASVVAVGMGLLALSIVAVLPPFKPHLPWPAAYFRNFSATPSEFPNDPALLLDKSTPVEAVAYLRAHPPRGRLWNDMGTGSYLIWALPGIKVSADPRVELYPDAFWQHYLALSKGPADFDEQLTAMGVSDVLCDSDTQPRLLARLRRSPLWREACPAGGTTHLFYRVEPGKGLR